MPTLLDDTTITKRPQEKLTTYRYKDFKISGSIGSEGQKDKLTYSSLAYQINNGVKKGFSETDVCALPCDHSNKWEPPYSR